MAYFTAQEVAELTGTPYGSLMYWVKEHLLNPEGARAGRRRATIWHDKDLREAAILNGLRRAGLSLQQLRRAIEYLRSVGHNPLSTGQFLVVSNQDGEPQDVIKLCDEGEAIDLLKQPGQLVLRLWDGDGD